MICSRKDDYAFFLSPVDLEQVPGYTDVVKSPMDFGTISRKLLEGQYETMEDFRKDIELVFSNCRKFNPPGTFPLDNADAVEKVFKKEWAKILELSKADKRTLQSVLKKLVDDPLYVLIFHC